MSARSNISILALFLVISLSTSLIVRADIPPAEREALIALYNSTDGPNWTNHDNWRNAGDTDFNEVGTECTWRGIMCSPSGDSVTRVDLASNGLTGNVPAGIGDLPELTMLNLSYNQLNGGIPPEVGNLSNVTVLNLSYNQFSGSIPPELGNLTSLYGFFGESNQLSGEIPAEFSNLATLAVLSLGTNQLSGTVPLIGGSNLSRVWFNSNLLSGNIPSWLASKHKLEWLDLSDNQFVGQVSPWIGNLSDLERLMLSSNGLTGGIPPEIGALSNLEYLYLDANRLIGSVPAQIVDLTSLQDRSGLNIQYNAVFSDDPIVSDFIAQKSTASDWTLFQTVPPDGLQVSWVGDHSVGLSWTAGDSASWRGGYEVFFALSGTEAWTSAGWTSEKYDTTYLVAGLNPANAYDFAVRTFTDPHAGNLNKVESNLGTPVTGTTTNNGTGMPGIIISESDPITLSVSGEYSTYMWSTEQTTPAITVYPNSGEWYWVQVTTTDDYLEGASILVGAGDDSPPTAFFSYTLSGLQLSLSDQSIDGPTSWQWGFGDGATSSEQNPAHTYASEGEYTVDLEVTDDVGSDTYSIQLVVDDGGGGFACDPIWVAAAASAGGLNETQWATDLGINNLGSAALRYAFQILPRGVNNTGEELGEVFTLESNTSVVYTDIWSELTGDEGAGAINVCVDNLGQAGVTTRTFNTGDSGTFGQTIVGVRNGGSELIGSGEKARLGFLSENAEFRTNIGFMNAGEDEISIDVEFFTNDGTLLGSDSINLAPLSNRQWNQAFRRATSDDVAAGYVDVWSDTPGASFLSYASMVDNATGDPTTIWPFEPGEASSGGDCRPIWIAAAASASGLNDTQWATDLGVNNLGPDPMSFRFQMLPRGQDNSDSEMSDTFTLGGDMGVAYTDVWSEMTGAEGAGSLSVCVDAGGIAGVTSRTYNTGNEGTFGQIIVGKVDAAQHLIGQGERARLGFLFQNDDFRTNIGFMNASDAAVTIEVEFFDADGSSLGTDSVTLAPLSNDLWNRAFTRVSSTDVVGGFVDVWSDTPGASFLTYGSVVDQETGDPSTIWPF